MRMRNCSAILSLILMLASCATNYNVQGTTSISRFDGKTAYIGLPTSDGRMAYDSAQINHGEFYFYGDVDSTVFAYLFVGGERVMPVVLETGNLSLQVGSLTQRASGTPLNDRLTRFFHQHGKIEDELYAIQQECMEMLIRGHQMDEVKDRYARRQQKLMRKLVDLETQFVQDNYNNVLGPNIFMLITSQEPFPVMTDQVRTILKKAPPQFLQDPYVRSYIQRCGYR
ncbi:MAG: DUF4369 domain-containing protein [Bacteroidaceae bacterium]|nr:DUF4369 domain-containing protein [Bacteroidaceae bacterium]